MRRICPICNLKFVRIKGKRKDGSPLYGSRCWKCSGGNKSKRKREKGKVCEFCGFIAILPCQLDIDHKDGNPKNNSPINKQTLCANCHRLKTYLNNEHLKH